MLAKNGALHVNKIEWYKNILSELRTSAQINGVNTISERCWNDLNIMAEFENIAEKGHSFKKKPQPLTQKNIEHLNIMLKRCKHFFDKYEYPTQACYTVESRTGSVRGKGDFLSPQYLLDFKTLQSSSGSPIKWKYRLQVTLYYLMGKEAWKSHMDGAYSEFETIKNIIIYNPRSDIAYIANISNIDYDMSNEIWGILDGM